MSWEDPTVCDLLAICEAASVVAPVKEENEFGNFEIVGYTASREHRSRSLAVGLLSHELIARLTKTPPYARGLTKRIDHFAWWNMTLLGDFDIPSAIANPLLPIRGTCWGGPWMAGLYGTYGLHEWHHPHHFVSAPASEEPDFSIDLLPLDTIVSSTPALKAAVAAQHAANHDPNPDAEDVANEIDSAYAASRAKWVSRLQASWPDRGYG